MNKRKIRIGVYTSLLVLALVALLGGPETLSDMLEQGANTPSVNRPSLFPVSERIVAIRFDPSYHYDGRRPKELARALAEKWQSAGINLLFYRVSDPQHGAFYRTKHRDNPMGDFGRLDLLRHVLRECKNRDIRVFGWFPVLNNSSAWNAHPDWRAKMAAGGDYQAQGLRFPLCARNGEVRQWWYGLLAEFIKQYPEIDGIDLGEPVVSWRKDDACHCPHCRQSFSASAVQEAPQDARARALTELLEESSAVVHRLGKQVSLTAVLTAAANGDLLEFDGLKEMTGLDLDRMLQAPGEKRPDIICPEFLWQQWKSLYAANAATSKTFTPDWTEKAVATFLRRVNTSINVLTHVEITDFPGAASGRDELKAVLRAALRGGATGIDVYSSSQMDSKNAWSALRNYRELIKTKRCLVLHDGEEGMSNTLLTAELIRHFRVEVTIQAMDDYAAGQLAQYDVVFYVGAVPNSTQPERFLRDLAKLDTTVCWLGFNLDFGLTNERLRDALGLEFSALVEKRYQTVRYKNRDLRKLDPYMNVVRVLNEEDCEVLATASDGEHTAPYAVRSNRRFWYIADIPSYYAIEGGRYLVFADLLHEIMNEDHAERHLAMIRLEDVHPLSDADELRRVANYLYKEDVPFQIAVVPFYVNPAENERVSMSDRPEFVSALKYMVERGGTVVMHGVTHQRFGETTADFEFWDPMNDAAPDGQNSASIRHKIEKGLREFWQAGIYPLMWETPHYAGSQQAYAVVSEYFSIAMERRMTMDHTGTDQCFPYLILRDKMGQTIVPENLGYVPLDRQEASVILDPARNMKVVRDGVASFFFHPFCKHSILKDIVKGMKSEGFTFTNIADLPISVRTSFGELTNGSLRPETQPLAKPASQEVRLKFPGIISETKDAAAEITRPKKGELVAVHPPLSDEQAGAEAKMSLRDMLRHVPNHFGESCVVPSPLLLVKNAASGRLLENEKMTKSMLGLVGIDVAVQSVEAFSHIPEDVNFLILPQQASSALRPDQVDAILDALSDGRISLVACGPSDLAAGLGVRQEAGETTVSHVEDAYYPGVDIQWNPPEKVSHFSLPGEAAPIFLDRETQAPLAVASRHEAGAFIYLGAGFETDWAGCYPHLLTHILRHFRMFPASRGAGYEIYFNPGDRDEETSIEDLVKHWRRSGVRKIYAAAWMVYPEWTYDYERLIQLAHHNAMLVHAWFEPPYINEKFWLDHPEWREGMLPAINETLQWRKSMDLGRSDSRRAALGEMRRMLEQYDWDGVVIEQYQDTLPLPSLVAILSAVDEVRDRGKNHLEIVLTCDERGDNQTYLSREDMRRLKTKYDLLLQLAATPERQWRRELGEFDAIQFSIHESAAERSFAPAAPTAYPTGLAFYSLLSERIRKGERFSLKSESALYDVDMQTLAFLFTGRGQQDLSPDALVMETSRSLELTFSHLEEQDLHVNGELAAGFSRNRLLLSAGVHQIARVGNFNQFTKELKSQTRIVDSSGEILRCAVNSTGIDVSYQTPNREILVLNEKPKSVTIGGKKIEFTASEGLKGWAIALPSGKHDVTVATRGYLSCLLVFLSLALSNTIVLISVIAIVVMAGIIIRSRFRARRHAQ